MYMIGNDTLDNYICIVTIRNQITSNYLTPIVIPCNNKKHLTRWHKKGIHIHFNTIQLLRLRLL